MKKGLFVTFEGGEGAGKTTLIEEIAKELKGEGLSVVKTREPGGTAFGEKIRALVLGNEGMVPYAELCLFLASRAQHIAEVISPSVKEGKIVLCDRFNDSSIAYQGMARGLGMEKIAKVCEIVCEEMKPDLTFYLDIDPEVGLLRTKKRKMRDRIEQERVDFHAKIREGYLRLCKENIGRIKKLDATKTPEQVYKEAMALLRKRL